MDGKRLKDSLRQDRLFLTNQGSLHETLLDQIIIYLGTLDPPVLNSMETDQLRNYRMERHERAAILLTNLQCKGEESCRHFYTALEKFDCSVYQELPSRRERGEEVDLVNKIPASKRKLSLLCQQGEDIYITKLKADRLHFITSGCINEDILTQVVNALRDPRPPVFNRVEAEQLLNDANALYGRVTELVNALLKKGEKACQLFYTVYEKLDPVVYRELPSS
eukprot:gi/632970332/ref/XP_007901590.1/ PREDICTED: uncharacterized protein LOC103185066 [Callorhinchus milii]